MACLTFQDETPETAKQEHILPVWETTLQDILIQKLDTEGWVLANASGGRHWHGNGYIEGMKLTFRRKHSCSTCSPTPPRVTDPNCGSHPAT